MPLFGLFILIAALAVSSHAHAQAIILSPEKQAQRDAEFRAQVQRESDKQTHLTEMREQQCVTAANKQFEANQKELDQLLARCPDAPELWVCKAADDRNSILLAIYRAQLEICSRN
jgi:hypothetical protein